MLLLPLPLPLSRIGGPDRLQSTCSNARQWLFGEEGLDLTTLGDGHDGHDSRRVLYDMQCLGGWGRAPARV